MEEDKRRWAREHSRRLVRAPSLACCWPKPLTVAAVAGSCTRALGIAAIARGTTCQDKQGRSQQLLRCRWRFKGRDGPMLLLSHCTQASRVPPRTVPAIAGLSAGASSVAAAAARAALAAISGRRSSALCVAASAAGAACKEEGGSQQSLWVPVAGRAGACCEHGACRARACKQAIGKRTRASVSCGASVSSIAAVASGATRTAVARLSAGARRVAARAALAPISARACLGARTIGVAASPAVATCKAKRRKQDPHGVGDSASDWQLPAHSTQQTCCCTCRMEHASSAPARPLLTSSAVSCHGARADSVAPGASCASSAACSRDRRARGGSTRLFLLSLPALVQAGRARQQQGDSLRVPACTQGEAHHRRPPRPVPMRSRPLRQRRRRHLRSSKGRSREIGWHRPCGQPALAARWGAGRQRQEGRLRAAQAGAHHRRQWGPTPTGGGRRRQSLRSGGARSAAAVSVRARQGSKQAAQQVEHGCRGGGGQGRARRAHWHQA